MGAVFEAVQFVDDSPTRILAVVVDAADVEENVAVERLTGECADLGDPFRFG